MSVTLNVTESQVLSALRSFLLSVLPVGVEVVKGQVNRVPSPAATNFVVVTPLFRTRLSTNVDSYTDPFPDPGASRSIQTATQFSIQLDVYGASASDNAQALMMVLRDAIACDALAASGLPIQPLYATDPKQMPFVTGEAQWQDRWTLDAELQVNATITTTQDFAGTLDVGLINVEATYPP